MSSCFNTHHKILKCIQDVTIIAFQFLSSVNGFLDENWKWSNFQGHFLSYFDVTCYNLKGSILEQKTAELSRAGCSAT
jgi:hypothetical protein